MVKLRLLAKQLSDFFKDLGDLRKFLKGFIHTFIFCTLVIFAITAGTGGHKILCGFFIITAIAYLAGLIETGLR